MGTTYKCPMCGAALVESGLVDGLGLIYMCDRDGCSSQDEEHNCDACGHPTAFVLVNADDEPDEAEEVWELRCFDPLCTTK